MLIMWIYDIIFIIFIGIEFAMKMSLELGADFVCSIVTIGIGFNGPTPKRNWNWNPIPAISTHLKNLKFKY